MDLEEQGGEEEVVSLQKQDNIEWLFVKSIAGADPGIFKEGAHDGESHLQRRKTMSATN